MIHRILTSRNTGNRQQGVLEQKLEERRRGKMSDIEANYNKNLKDSLGNLKKVFPVFHQILLLADLTRYPGELSVRKTRRQRRRLCTQKKCSFVPRT